MRQTQDQRAPLFVDVARLDGNHALLIPATLLLERHNTFMCRKIDEPACNHKVSSKATSSKANALTPPQKHYPACKTTRADVSPQANVCRGKYVASTKQDFPQLCQNGGINRFKRSSTSLHAPAPDALPFRNGACRQRRRLATGHAKRGQREGVRGGEAYARACRHVDCEALAAEPNTPDRLQASRSVCGGRDGAPERGRASKWRWRAIERRRVRSWASRKPAVTVT